MRVRRDVSSIPYQSAGETWQRIIDLVTGRDSKDVEQLRNAAGVMGSIITDKHPAACAIMIEGVGPQLRIYCRYGMKAVEEGSAVDSLSWNPTAGDWTMHVPCDSENIEWVKSSLSKTSARIKVFDASTSDRAEEEGSEVVAKAGSHLVVDWNVKG
jgi:hypothetical protein